MAQETILVSLQVKDTKALDGLEIDNGCMPFRRRADGSVDMVAAVTAATLRKLKTKRSVTVERLPDTKETALRAARNVSRANRYADGSLPVPFGVRGVRHVD